MGRWRRQTGTACPPEEVTREGTEPLTIGCRFGRVHVRRQVLCHRPLDQHVMPANAVLPPHGQIVITRGVQELSAQKGWVT